VPTVLPELDVEKVRRFCRERVPDTLADEDYGPVQLAVAAGATAEESSEVNTLAGSSAADTAQIVSRKGPTPALG